ncbi:MAG: TIGR02391 family protein, partial [Candidatus Micrarchaeota archaeon]
KKDIKEGISLLTERGMHPRIVEVSGSLFATEHYPQAIFEAFKEVNNSVKRKSKLLGEDGASLMTKAFNSRNPKLRFSELKTRTEIDEQDGFMHIFMGSMLGIRNPKAHENIVQKDPVKTIEYLSLASLLLRRVEEAESR